MIEIPLSATQRVQSFTPGSFPVAQFDSSQKPFAATRLVPKAAE